MARLADDVAAVLMKALADALIQGASVVLFTNTTEGVKAKAVALDEVTPDMLEAAGALRDERDLLCIGLPSDRELFKVMARARR